MGTEKTDYVIVGIKTKYEEIGKYFNLSEFELEEKFKDLIVNEMDCKVGDFTYITDGISGEYAVLGIVVSKSEDYNGEGIEMIDCIEMFNEYKLEVTEYLRKMCIPFGKISIYTFSYYS